MSYSNLIGTKRVVLSFTLGGMTCDGKTSELMLDRIVWNDRNKMTMAKEKMRWKSQIKIEWKQNFKYLTTYQ